MVAKNLKRRTLDKGKKNNIRVVLSLSPSEYFLCECVMFDFYFVIISSNIRN